jgi:hypothetical protein
VFMDLQTRTYIMLNEYQQKDLALINNPSQWPSIVLPLVNRKRTLDNAPRCAFLVRNHNNRLYRLYLMNIWELQEDISLESQLRNVPSIEFESLEAMLEDGWEVD